VVGFPEAQVDECLPLSTRRASGNSTTLPGGYRDHVLRSRSRGPYPPCPGLSSAEGVRHDLTSAPHSPATRQRTLLRAATVRVVEV